MQLTSCARTVLRLLAGVDEVEQIEAAPLRPVPMAILLKLAREGNLAYDDAVRAIAANVVEPDVPAMELPGADLREAMPSERSRSEDGTGATSADVLGSDIASVGQALLQRSLSQESTESTQSERRLVVEEFSANVFHRLSSTSGVSLSCVQALLARIYSSKLPPPPNVPPCLQC